MKKISAVILAVIMLMTCMVPALAANEPDTSKCTCKDHIADAKCHCCVYCPNLDTTYRTSCVKYDENGVASFCCSKCTGIWPCTCGCECCANYANIDNGTGLPLLNDEQQKSFISGFQNVLKIISNIFDRLLGSVIDFLRIGDVFPDLFN